MKKFFYKVWSSLLCMLGNVKIFNYPFWIVYDPNMFKVTGDKVLEIMEILEPGMILLRGYDSYLDSHFVPSKRGYSHGAIYAGNNTVIHAVAQGVSEINIIDFCACDRICVLRPKKGQKQAMKNAKQFLKNKIPYDYGFANGVSALYCFELVAEAYPKLDIKRIEKKTLFGLIKKNVYLSDSMFESSDLEVVFEYNPKFGINFRKV